MRELAKLTILMVGVAVIVSGCVSPWTTSAPVDEESELAESLESKPLPEFVGDIARPVGMTVLRAESLGVVNGLPGTGGAPQPSPQLTEILRELRTDNIPNPNHFLESNNTALVTVTALLHPGAQKEDPVDLQVQLSRQSNASDISRGWLMPVRLRELRVLGGMIRDGDVLALGRGKVISASAINGSLGENGIREGIIPGGGRLTKSRELGLQLQIDKSLALPERVAMTNQISSAINRRFSFFDGQGRHGIASAKKDNYLSIAVYPRYRRNIHRQMNVVQAISVATDAARPDVLAELESELKVPATARQAALKLEAVGDAAIGPLQAAVVSENPELKFYAAEALAYLNQESAVKPLIELIETEAAFRHSALLAIGTMEHPVAAESLASLLHHPSNEVRFGAYRELVEREDAFGLLARRRVEGVDVVVIPSQTEPLVAVSTVRQPGIVIFGAPVRLDVSRVIYAADGLTVRGEGDGRIRISMFATGKPDSRVVVPATVEGCIDGMLQAGAPLSQIIEFLRESKNQGSLPTRFAVNPIPETGRLYHREEADPAEDEPEKVARDQKPAEKSPAGSWFSLW